MDVYSSDNEQAEVIRNFFRENGISILLGVVLSIGGIYGWRYWKEHQVTSTYNTSAKFESAMDKLFLANNEADALTFASENANNYGAMAGLELAKYFVTKGELDKAQKQLEVASNQTKDADLLSLIHLRLARIQFEQKQAEPALASLAKVKTGSWIAEADLIKGNILVSQNKLDEAMQVYEAGLKANPSSFIESQLLIQIEKIKR